MRTEDGCIIHRCLNGEPEAFGLLVDKYKSGIYAFAYAKLHDFQDAEDVAQEVFVQAYRDLRSLKRWESFVFWLYRIASTRCSRWLRTRSRQPDSEFIADQDPKALAVSSLHSHHENHLNESVREALESLSQTYREILMLYYFAGMNTVDISRALGASPAAIRQRLSRARAKLKKEMIAMMRTDFEGQGLRTSFTFRIAEAIKRTRVSPMTPPALPWGLSLSAGIIIAVLCLNPRLNLPNRVDKPMLSAHLNEIQATESEEFPVDVLETSGIPALFVRQDDGHGGEAELPHETNDDLEAIRELFVTLEQGYEEHDLEKYISVFNSEDYEYIGDMATPDDPTDDAHYLGTEKERSGAERVFRNYEILDLSLTRPKITIDGGSAKVRNEISILFSPASKESLFPTILHADTSNVYSLKKLKGDWKIVHWEQHETPPDELVARRKQAVEERGIEALIHDLGSDNRAIWAMAISDLREVRETYIAPLIAALHSPDESIRYRTIWVLAGTRNEDAANALSGVLTTEENSADIRVAAVKALTALKVLVNPSHPAVDKALLFTVVSGNPKVNSAASLALALSFGWRMDRFPKYAQKEGLSEEQTKIVREDMIKSLMESLASPVQSLRRPAIISLGSMKHQPALESLNGILLDKGEDDSIRMYAADSIFKIDQNKAIDPLVQIMKDRDEPVKLRQVAARHLSSLKDLQSVCNESYVEALEAASSDEDKQIATIARQMLHQIRAKLEDDLIK